MNKIRVLATKKFLEEDLSFLRSGFSSRVELIVPSTYSDSMIAELAAERVHVLLGERISKEILDRASDLLLIQIPWTGVDRLDFNLLRRYRIPVCNSHSNAGVVAEMAVGLMLAAVKKIPLHDARLRQGKWMRPQSQAPESFCPPSLLTGATAGFIGFGAIARRISRILNGFEMRFISTDAHSPSGKADEPIEILPPDRLWDIAARSDVVFVTVPLVPATRGLIEYRFFEAMKNSAYLINTSRGEIVDEAALFQALKTKRIAGAAIDTWYQYPKTGQTDVLPSARFPFHELDNIVLSPHRAGFAEGDLPHLKDVVENINRLAAGRPLLNLVDVQAGF